MSVGMNAMPPTFFGSPALERRDACAAELRWAALRHAGHTVAMMAGVLPGLDGDADRFALRFRAALPFQREIVDRSVEDLSCMMQHGMAALLAIETGGGNPRPAARALFAELQAARAGVMALFPDGEVSIRHITN